MATLPKNFQPAMFDEAANVTCMPFEAAFVHDFDVECGNSDCMDARHFRLLNLETEKEVTGMFDRIHAMVEVWHGKIS